MLAEIVLTHFDKVVTIGEEPTRYQPALALAAPTLNGVALGNGHESGSNGGSWPDNGEGWDDFGAGGGFDSIAGGGEENPFAMRYPAAAQRRFGAGPLPVSAAAVPCQYGQC